MHNEDLTQKIRPHLQPRWQKTALIVAKTLQEENQITDAMIDQIIAALRHLARDRIIEIQGNLADIRHSEVRLKSHSSNV